MDPQALIAESNVMKTKSFLKRLASVATLLVLALPTVALGQAPNRVDVLIGFSSPPTREDVGVVRAMGGQVRHVYSIVPAIAASVPEPALRGLAGDRRVRYVEEDAQVFTTSQTIPWGIHRVFGDSTDARIATWDWARKGDNIKVAVLDSGIASHPDLNVVGGTTFYGSNYDDGLGHGTHVAGTIAALDNSIGVVGVGPNIELYAVKVFSDSGEGYMSDVIAGLQWAANENNGHGVMDIVNMSLSGPASQTLENAVNAAYNQGAGILLVASAGNDGSHPRFSRVGYPARYNAVIAVAATTQSNTRASFSSTGPEVELSAPGVEILSTVPGDGYASYQGTSMAAPHVAGVAALIMATNPDLTASQVREILRETAQNLGDPNHFGYGLVRANEAVTVSVPPDPPPRPANLEAIPHDTYVTLSWDHSATATSYDIYRAAEGATYDPIASGLQTTSYLDLGLQNGTTYSYYVTAWNAAGESHWSSVVSAKPAAATSAPLAPSDFTAVALSRSQIALSWTDNADNESGFEIQRRDGSATVTFWLGPNVTSYLDSGLEPNTQYTYSLRAYNSAGFSDAAGPAHATTFVQPSAAFVAQDTTAKGTWKGVYGTDGYHIVRKANGTAGPFIDGLGAAVSVSGAAIHSWEDPSSDPRALQRPDTTARFADCYYQSGTISLQLSLPQMSRVSLYFVDWDTTARRQTITITDAADPIQVLDSKSLSSSFNGGLISPGILREMSSSKSL
jgi:subtilisin